MKVSDLSTGNINNDRLKIKRILMKCGKKVKVNISDYAKEIYTIKISDWRTVRKWKFQIADGKTGILTYGKRTVISSDDFDAIAEALYNDESRLSKADVAKTLKQSNKKGDLIPTIINELSQKFMNAGVVVKSTSTMDSISAYKAVSTNKTHSRSNVHIYIGFTATTINISVSSTAGNRKFDIDMADPGFCPYRLADVLIRRMMESKSLVEELRDRFGNIWDQPLI